MKNKNPATVKLKDLPVRAPGGHQHRSFVLYGRSGCIDGDSPVKYSIRSPEGEWQNQKGGTLAHLYRRFNGIQTPGRGYYQRPQTVDSRYYIQSMDEEGRIFRNEIAEVIDSGVKRCIRVRTERFSLVCTPDHPLATVNGFFPAAEIGVGGRVLTHQNIRRTASDDERMRRPQVLVKHHPLAPTKVVHAVSGQSYEYKRLSRARAVYEAHLNGLDFSTYLKLLNDGVIEGLQFVESDHDIHHIDENPLNDVPSNLVAMSSAEHDSYHAKRRPDFLRSFTAVEEVIEAIEDVDERHTYDIRMASAPHNFVVSRFVVHNTGKTTLSGTFPGRRLLLDVRDSGDDSLQGVEDLDVLDVTTWDDFEMAYWWLKQNPDKYGTLVIDTMSQLQQVAILKVLDDKGKDSDRAGEWGVMTKKEWGDVASLMKTWIINLRDLPMEVVFIAQDRTFNVGEEDEAAGLDPEVGPGLSPSIAKALNAAVHCVANTFIRRRMVRVKVKNPPKGSPPYREVARIEYCLRVGPNSTYITKMRKAKIITLPDVIVDPTYDKLMAIINGGGEKQ